jgi:hypothetical protein
MQFTMMALAIATLSTATAAASPEVAPGALVNTARVRTTDTRAATLLIQALDRSATVRALVNQLEQRDVIVYIGMQPKLTKRLAGALTWLTATKEHRYVRVSLNPQLHTELAIATLGHELQHALEVANAPEIVCEKTLARYYSHHGDSSAVHGNGWDTAAARDVGADVRRELAGLQARRVNDSIQPFDPDDWLVVYRRARSMLPP